MENYENLGTIGEGTYGVVLKCRHRVTGQIVAIKRFKESDDDEQVKKTALREIKVLKQLKHENIVSLLEVFRMQGKLYLVFEFVEKTMLEEIEKHPDGLASPMLKRLMWQLLRAIHFCHQHNIIHRDIKPENLLVSRNGVLKLCDFGFARPLAAPGAKYTEYVSTRWYRAPELLVGDVSYGKGVDIWSIGCMFAEIATGLPLFPGDSDIDQLYHIIRCLGHITPRQNELFKKNALYVGVKLPNALDHEPLDARFPQFNAHAMDFLQQTIKDEPLDRWTCAELLQHPFFENEGAVFEQELQEAIQRDLSEGQTLLRKKRARGGAHRGLPPSRGSDANAGDSLSMVSPRVGIAAVASKPTGAESPHEPSQSTSKAAVKPMPTPAPTLATKKQAATAAATVVLPTLTPAQTSSSSNLLFNPGEMPANAKAHPLPSTKKAAPHGNAVAVFPMHSEAMAMAMGVTVPPRISMTSQSGRPNGMLAMPPPQQPFVFQSLAPPPKPPPTSYPRNPYLSPPPSKPSRVLPTSKASSRGATESDTNATAHMQDLGATSPGKKTGMSVHPHGNASKRTTPTPAAVAPLPSAFAMNVAAPLDAVAAYHTGTYVPPKTSHHSNRGAAGGNRHR